MAELISNDIQNRAGIRLKSLDHIYRNNYQSKVRRIFWLVILFLLLILFLPWNQNIRSEGSVTALRPEQRPQQLNNFIPGRIVKWWVKEGDLVKKGDTIVQLAEIKDAYLDPNLMSRTKEQLVAEQSSIGFYEGKVDAVNAQISALDQERNFKMKAISNKYIQALRKAESDSLELIAVKNEMTVAERQIEAANKMFSSGVIPLTELERRRINFQNTSAKLLGTQNKFNNSKQDVLIVMLEKEALVQEYAEKIAKASGDQLESRSKIADGQGKLSKLQNQLSNYSIRSGQYFVIAPQDGQVVKARKAGINEVVKEGDMIVEIVPGNYDKAVELWVAPMDLQLLSVGQKVRFMFDGFPAIVFSGWPAASYGTFSGKIAAIEGNTDKNGKFRILVTQDPGDRPWPESLKMGGGAIGFALLKVVPIWYELWRRINGFPPDFYKDQNSEKVIKR
jgi:multidrug efflux pump subunit AcrA (membrane-fusion protein)